MNGTASRSMRDKGLNYKINWGVSLGELRQMASDYGKDYDLAVALWQDNIRECKILATLTMPPEHMTESMAEQWIAETKSTEIVEMCAFNTFQYMDGAESMACKWLASNNARLRTCAFHILSRLLQKCSVPSEDTVVAFLRAFSQAMEGTDKVLKHAGMNCLSRFVQSDDRHAVAISDALHDHNLDIFA